MAASGGRVNRGHPAFGGRNFGQRLYPISGSFARSAKMNSTSFVLTSRSVALSDSQRTSLRIVKSRRCSRVKSWAISASEAASEVVDAVGQIFPNVDFPVRVSDFVDDFEPHFRLLLRDLQSRFRSDVIHATSSSRVYKRLTRFAFPRSRSVLPSGEMSPFRFRRR